MNQQSGNNVQGSETIILIEARPTLANKRQREIQSVREVDTFPATQGVIYLSIYLSIYPFLPHPRLDRLGYEPAKRARSCRPPRRITTPPPPAPFPPRPPPQSIGETGCPHGRKHDGVPEKGGRGVRRPWEECWLPGRLSPVRRREPTSGGMADAQGPCQDTSMLSAAADAEDAVTDEKVPVTLEVCQASTSTATSEDIASRVRMYFSTRGLTYRDGPLSINPGTDPYLDKHVDAICMCDTEGAKATPGARLLSWQVDLSVYVHQLNDDDVAGTTACRGHTLSNLRLRSYEDL